MLKDLHSHLLFGIDDGSKSIEESITLIREASNQGITDLMITPHYMEDTKYDCNNKEKRKLFEELKEEVKKENIKINLYLGNEVFISNKFLELIKKGEIETLNNSKYLLFEFPLGNIWNNSKNIMYDLLNVGCVPVMAHPERYKQFQRHIDAIDEFTNIGVLLQGNYRSLYGKYGRDSKKALISLLKKKKISFLGSDCHHDSDFQLKKLRKDLIKITKDEEYVDKIMYGNFDKVIDNKDIEINE